MQNKKPAEKKIIQEYLGQQEKKIESALKQINDLKENFKLTKEELELIINYQKSLFDLKLKIVSSKKIN